MACRSLTVCCTNKAFQLISALYHKKKDPEIVTSSMHWPPPELIDVNSVAVLINANNHLTERHVPVSLLSGYRC